MDNLHELTFTFKDYVIKVPFKTPLRSDTTLVSLDIDDYIDQTHKRVLATLDEARKAMREEQNKRRAAETQGE